MRHSKAPNCSPQFPSTWRKQPNRQEKPVCHMSCFKEHRQKAGPARQSSMERTLWQNCSPLKWLKWPNRPKKKFGRSEDIQSVGPKGMISWVEPRSQQSFVSSLSVPGLARWALCERGLFGHSAKPSTAVEAGDTRFCLQSVRKSGTTIRQAQEGATRHETEERPWSKRTVFNSRHTC